MLSYERRILEREQEARDVVARPVRDGVGAARTPEVFRRYRLPEICRNFALRQDRLDVRCGLSEQLLAAPRTR